jgi:hypothetical protein
LREIIVPNIEVVPVLGSERKAFRVDERDQALVEIGLFETGEKFRFRCPVCGKVEVNDQRMEPVCSGPGWTDTHPHEVMFLETG